MDKGLNYPAYKLSVADLTKAQRDPSSESEEFILTIEKDISVTLHMVWLQGTLTDVTKVEHVTLRDETGAAYITGYSSIPGGSDWIAPGMYVGVIGELQETDVVPKVRAVKMMNLSSNPVFKSMWLLEVKDLKAYLTKKTEPVIV